MAAMQRQQRALVSEIKMVKPGRSQRRRPVVQRELATHSRPRMGATLCSPEDRLVEMTLQQPRARAQANVARESIASF
jgi:hypothetical protein